MNYPKRYRAVEYCRNRWHIEGPNGVVYDDALDGKDKPVIWCDEDEVLEAVEKMNTFAEENNCPICQETLVHANPGNGQIDTYCEECGWPDETRGGGMNKNNFVSGGRDPNWQEVCGTCVYLNRDTQSYYHGRCRLNNASVTVDGYCDNYKKDHPLDLTK